MHKEFDLPGKKKGDDEEDDEDSLIDIASQKFGCKAHKDWKKSFKTL